MCPDLVRALHVPEEVSLIGFAVRDQAMIGQWGVLVVPAGAFNQAEGPECFENGAGGAGIPVELGGECFGGDRGLEMSEDTGIERGEEELRGPGAFGKGVNLGDEFLMLCHAIILDFLLHYITLPKPCLQETL